MFIEDIFKMESYALNKTFIKIHIISLIIILMKFHILFSNEFNWIFLMNFLTKKSKKKDNKVRANFIKNKRERKEKNEVVSDSKSKNTKTKKFIGKFYKV